MYDFCLKYVFKVSPTPFNSKFDRPSIHRCTIDSMTPISLGKVVGCRFLLFVFGFDFFFTEDLLLFTLPRFGQPQLHIYKWYNMSIICCKLIVIEFEWGLTKRDKPLLLVNSWHFILIPLIGHFLHLGRF